MSVKVRTVTYFTELTASALDKSEAFFTQAKQKFTQQGWTVRSYRIATDSHTIDVEQLKMLDEELAKRGLILNLGPLTDISVLPRLEEALYQTKHIFFNYALTETCSQDFLVQLVKMILSIATRAGVQGSFRFCVSSQCPPYIPFFPAASAASGEQPCFAIGLENSGILGTLKGGDADPSRLESELLNALTPILKNLEQTCMDIEAATGIHYRHIDSSLAPSLNQIPMTDLWLRCGIDTFGDTGTLGICAGLTAALKSLPVRLGGFCGLMLPVCEDQGLSEAADQGHFRISDLLYYSTVCACGLDCVAVPGISSDREETQKIEKKLAMYLSDMYAISHRLKKPLSCRLLPAPGQKPGEQTSFEFQHVRDGNVMEL